MPADVRTSGQQIQVAATAFFALFSVVGLALYGLPLYYDFMVREFGWSRTMVTSGNALSRLVVGPLFGFGAGWIVDRFGPRRLMMAGILMAGVALIGLGAISALWMFYFFYLLNALGYVCGGPLPNQVLLSRWFDRTRGKRDGRGVPRHRHRRRAGADSGGMADAAISAGGCRFSPRRADGADRAAAGVLCQGGSRLRASGPRGAGASGPNRRPYRPSAPSCAHPRSTFSPCGSMCSIAAVGGTNQHLKLFLSLDRGYSQGDAARIISLVLACSIVGRLLMGWLADRMPKKFVMLANLFAGRGVRSRCCWPAPCRARRSICSPSCSASRSAANT